MVEETEIGGDQVRFQPTAWTVVREAKEGSREALDRLIEVYWKPVYFFIRRRGQEVESAKDLTQGFFALLLEKDTLKDVGADKGRFRSFLLAAVTHFLSNEKDRAQALKRGGGFNFVQAEVELVSADPTPEGAFRRKWAQEILSRAMARLRDVTRPEDLGLLSGKTPAEMSPTDRKNRAHRLRLKLRELLREEIRPSVEGESEVDSELREVQSILS